MSEIHHQEHQHQHGKAGKRIAAPLQEKEEEVMTDNAHKIQRFCIFGLVFSNNIKTSMRSRQYLYRTA